MACLGWRWLVVIVGLVYFGVISGAEAHPLDVTATTIREQGPGKVLLTTHFTARQLAVHYLQAEYRYEAHEFSRLLVPLEADVRQQLHLTSENQACAVGSHSFRYDSANTTRLTLAGVVREAIYDCAITTRTLSITNQLFTGDFPDQRNLVVLAGIGGDVQAVFTRTQTQAIFNFERPQFHFAGQTSWRQFIVLGLQHVAIGYDHIAFIIGIHLVVRNLRQILKIVTSFTVAHSITLTLAALEIITLPSSLVEACIAATIVFIGVENLLRRQFINRWRITFGLGLIHGLGFSSVLKEIGVSRQFLLPNLVGFNIGVEIGQLLIIALIVPLLLIAASRPRLNEWLVYVGSIAISALGLVWLLERLPSVF